MKGSKIIEIITNQGSVLLNVDCIASVVEVKDAGRIKAKITLISDKICEYSDANNNLYVWESMSEIVRSIENTIGSENE